MIFWNVALYSLVDRCFDVSLYIHFQGNYTETSLPIRLDNVSLPEHSTAIRRLLLTDNDLFPKNLFIN
jgi:hypothetical protein